MASTRYARLAPQIIASVKKGLTNQDAALAAGIDRGTLADWEKRYPAFATQLAHARATRAENWMGWLVKAAQGGDVKAITELLDRCAPQYRKTTTIGIGGADGGPIMFEPQWIQIRAVILAILATHPDALADVAEHLDALEAGNGTEPLRD